jgi:hypothetical protein
MLGADKLSRVALHSGEAEPVPPGRFFECVAGAAGANAAPNLGKPAERAESNVFVYRTRRVIERTSLSQTR